MRLVFCFSRSWLRYSTFLDALLAGLARRVVAALDRALLRVAAIALKEKLRPLTTAQTQSAPV